MTVSVELNWDLSPTDPADVDGQRVYRTTVENPAFPGDFTEIAELGDSATTYQDDDAPAGEEVTYAVTAFNDAGESEPITTNIVTDVFGISALVNSESVEIRDIFTQIDEEVKEVSEVFAQVDGESRQV